MTTSDYIQSINKIIISLKPSPLSVFLFGSTARSQHKPDSDIDLLFIWKRRIPVNILSIKKVIETSLQKKVDLVNMIYTSKYYEFGNEDNFIDNVKRDAKYVFGDRDLFNMNLSVLIGKV